MPRVVLGVTGGIAAYKAADLARALTKKNIDVVCVMSDAAREFVTPLTLRTLTNNPVYCDMFHDAKEPGAPVEHIDLARNCDLMVIMPATANFIGKIACGIADDLLTTTVMACEKKVIIVPAMNKSMWANPVVKENAAKLKKLGYEFIGPKECELACGEYGAGHIEDMETVIAAITAALKKNSVSPENPGSRIPGPEFRDSCLAGKTILITSGPTREYIDDVRFISNPSSGKTGYYLAGEAKARGAKVIFITGKTALVPGADVIEHVVSAADMLGKVKKYAKDADIIIGAAAVGDFTVKKVKGKIARRNPKPETQNPNLTLELHPTVDILAELGKTKGKKFIAGFSAEAGSDKIRAKNKMKAKKLDMVILNDIGKKGLGFESDENEITIIDKKGRDVFTGKGTKQKLASAIMDAIEEAIS
jgi:phosphopantothenoylcysteine decarboxylase / phosphopantothenate---cysteine ligase